MYESNNTRTDAQHAIKTSIVHDLTSIKRKVAVKFVQKLAAHASPDAANVDGRRGDSHNGAAAPDVDRAAMKKTTLAR